jgi:type IV pilus assembly protein PilM
MQNQPGVWGIDLGQCALKALRLEEIDGQVTATTFDYVEHPKILSQPDADPDQLTREALLKFLSRNTLKGDTVVISVPGQSGLARFVKLPPVEEKKIADIVRFEAKQQIPFNLDEVVWDYQKLSQGAVTDGFAMETEIGLFAMKRDMVNRYIDHFKDVGVEVHIVQMAPLALCNFVAFDLLGQDPGAEAGEEGAEARGCIVALDIGADASNLIITDGGRIIWQRPIPLGGNHFTRALTKDLKLTFAKAEHLKRNATKSPDLKKILAALKPVLNDFVSEVQRSLAFFANTHRDAHIDYMIGLGNAFRLPGLQKYLAEKLSLDVRKLAKMERLGGDAVVTQQVYTENILSFGVAYGLAVQGMKHSRLVTNLLPGEIRIERLVRAKKPWAVAAATALLLGSGAFTWSYYLDDRPYSPDNPQIKSALDSSKDSVGKAAQAENQFNSTRTKAIGEEAAVKSIVAGQMERRNWLEILKFVSDVVPRPDGTNLPTRSAERRYFLMPPARETHPNFRRGGLMTGKEAWEKYKAAQDSGRATLLREGLVRGESDDSRPAAETAPALGDELPAYIDDLIEINIESVDCRFCGNLGAFWAAVRKEVTEDEDVRPKDAFDKPPEGRGWVVELSGYTWNHRAPQFLRDTLLENLARMAGTPKPPAAAAAKPGQPAAAGAPPAPAATPGKAPGKAVAKKPPPFGPAVMHNISHATLFKHKRREKCPPRAAYEYLGQDYVSGLVTAVASSSSAPSSLHVGAGGGGGSSRTASAFSSMASPNLKAAAGDSPGEGYHVRTEFVVLFIWYEPTESDDLRGMGGK